MAPGQCEDSVRTRFLPWPNHVNWGFPVTSVGNSHTTTRPERGALPLRISRKKGSFFETSACPRFCTQVRSMGQWSPYNPQIIRGSDARVTTEVTGLPSLLPPLAAAKQAEDYTILRSHDTLYRWHLLGFGQTKIIYYILPDITRKIENELIFYWICTNSDYTCLLKILFYEFLFLATVISIFIELDVLTRFQA